MSVPPLFRCRGAVLSVLLIAPVLRCQSLMNASAGRLVNSDLAALEVEEPRKDLPCTVNPVQPNLGFDLRFHAGYDVSIPLKELAGTEDMLTMIFRVTPAERKDDPQLFIQRVKVPPIEADAKGDALLQGVFDVGEGKYHVAWLMRDRSEHICSSYWDVEAALPAKDKQLSLALAPGAVEPVQTEIFKEEPPVERARDQAPLNVKVLVNFAPQNQAAATLQPLDTMALVSILRTIAREPRFGKFSVVAFNLSEQRILYRQDNGDRIDFPSLGKALESLNLGTIDIKTLNQKNGETEFLSGLVQKELGSSDHPDALIFAGPKVNLDDSVPQSTLKELGNVEYPVFYMNYNSQPTANPWRDAIGRTVKFFRGDEFTITRPRDLWAAISDIVSRVVRVKNARRAYTAPAQ